MINQYNRDTTNNASSKDTSARDTSAQNTGARVIGRRQLLSTLALGSTALVGMVSLKNETGVAGNGVSTARVTSYRVNDTGVHDTGVHDTSVHDAIFSPAAAQDAVFEFRVASRWAFAIDSQNKITQYTNSNLVPAHAWQGSSVTDGLITGFVDASGSDNRLIYPYTLSPDSTGILKTSVLPSPPSQYTAAQVAPLVEVRRGRTLVLYPVTSVTALGERLFTGFYAKTAGYAGNWQYFPSGGGMNPGIELDVLVAVENQDGTQSVIPFPIGTVGDPVMRENDFIRITPESGYLATGTADEVTALQAFSSALDALEFGTGGIEPGDSNPLRVVLGLPTTTITTDAPEIVAPTTSTVEPTTSTNVATTANATMAPTTTLVSTTGNGTTVAGTTLVSPTIAGDLSVRGAINAQGNIGANVSRSLSGRLSSFRARNRPRR